MSETPTPKSIARPFSSDRYHRDIENARREGIAEGRTEARKEFLDWLNKEYMNPNLNRQSVEAQAILIVTRDMGRFFNRTGQAVTKR